MRKIYLLLAVLFIASETWGQILAWHFDGAAGNEATANATTNHPDINQSILSRGSGVAATALDRTFSSDNFTGSTGIPGTRDDALSNDEFMTFSINPKPGTSVSLSTLDARLCRTATGATTYKWRYSTDGINFTTIGTDVSFISTATDGVQQPQINLSVIGALQNVQNPTTITIRLYAWGATGSSGIFGFGRYAPGNTTNSLVIGGTTVASIPTPVELISFAGQKEETKNVLRWTTASENNNRGFEVQYSKDGSNYSVLGFVSSIAQGGFSASQLNYTFTDINPSGVKHYYRLRQLDYDGRSKFSSIVMIRGNKPLSLAIGGIFPNPANGSLVNVIIDAPKQDRVTLVVTDFSGRIVKQKAANVESGSNTIPVDISQLTQGNYLMKVVCSSGCELAIGKFNKQ
jgi:hypothetical protein